MCHEELRMQEHAANLVHDTQEKKRVANRVRRNDEIFRLRVESVSDYAIFFLDDQGNIARWNQGGGEDQRLQSRRNHRGHFSRFYQEDAQEMPRNSAT